MDYKRRHWTSEEKSKLIELYEQDGLSASEIAPILNRTHVSIKIKIDRWKLRHTKEQKIAARKRATAGSNNGMFGKVGANKGLTKENSERIAAASRKMSAILRAKSEAGLLRDISGKNNPMYGVPAWNKGQNKETDSRIKSYGLKLSIAAKKRWNNMSDTQKDTLRQRCARIGIQKKAFTSIEKKIHSLLDNMGVRYVIGFDAKYYICDIYLPDDNLIIECQGDYWHANPNKYSLDSINKTQARNVHRDKTKKSYLTNLGYKLLYLWEYDINYRWHAIEEIFRNLRLTPTIKQV